MSKVTIEFWDNGEEKYVDDVNGNRLAVDPSGAVFEYSFDDPSVCQFAFWITPHFYKDGERIA